MLLAISLISAIQSLWTIDICMSYYHQYGDFNFTIPTTNIQTSTWNCYHENLNDIVINILSILLWSLFTGYLISEKK